MNLFISGGLGITAFYQMELKNMKNNRQTSVIKRMYAGFALMVALLVATVVLMLDGTSRIHRQLDSVTSDAFPLSRWQIKPV